MFRRTLFFSICYFFLKKIMNFTIFQQDMKRLDYLPKEEPFIDKNENEETWGHFIDIDIYS